MVQQVKVLAAKSDSITSTPGPTYSKRRDRPRLPLIALPHTHHRHAHTFYQCATAPVAQ